LLTKEGDKEVLVDDDELNGIRVSLEFGSTTDTAFSDRETVHKDLKPMIS
jgi:hypothetical protein